VEASGWLAWQRHAMAGAGWRDQCAGCAIASANGCASGLRQLVIAFGNRGIAREDRPQVQHRLSPNGRQTTAHTGRSRPETRSN